MCEVLPVRSNRKYSIQRLVALSALTLAPLVHGCFDLTPPPTDTELAPFGTTDRPLPVASEARLPYPGACAQNVVNCTSSFPVAMFDVVEQPNQVVTPTTDPPGFIVEGTAVDGVETVALSGDISTLGNGASVLTYRWTFGATDADPCTLTPGTEFSAEPNPNVAMEAGLHLIRLTVENDLVRNAESSGLEACGVIEQGPKSDFVELLIDVRGDTGSSG